MSLEAIGIDFGTTHTAAAAIRPGQGPELIPIDPAYAQAPSLLKSLIYFPNRKDAFFGADAIREYFDRDREGRFLQSVKKLLSNSEFQGTSIHGSFVSVEELIARFLRETRKRIQIGLGIDSIEGIPVIMGRPARYSLDPEREKLAMTRFQKACELAGFGGCRFLEEPNAAALTYEPPGGQEERILVADLGGGTSDFTLMRLGGGKPSQVLGVSGVPLAGDALDSAFMLTRLARFFGSEIRYQRPFSSNVLTLPTSFVRLLPKWHHHAFLKEKSTWNFLKTLHQELVDKTDKQYLDNLITLVEDNLGYALHQRVEGLKMALSSAQQADFSFRSYPIAIEFPVTLAEFEALCLSIAQAIQKGVAEVLQQAQVEPSQVDAVYFTGGTSQVPLLRRTILELAPKARVAEKDTFTSVAAGLALAHRS